MLNLIEGIPLYCGKDWFLKMVDRLKAVMARSIEVPAIQCLRLINSSHIF